MQKISAADFPRSTPRQGATRTYDEWRDLPYRPAEDCPVCKGAGFLHPVHGGVVIYREIKPCGCLTGSLNMNLPPKQTFETFQQVPGTEKAFKTAWALAYGEADFIWYLLYGPPGNGKTHLCKAIVEVVRQRGIDVKMILSADLFSMLREAIRDNQTDALLRRFKDIFFLAIDDYGVEYGSDWEQAKFDELMTSRYATGKPTVLITNKEISELPGRIQSRFKDKKMARAIHNSAPDFRQRR